MGRNNSLSNTPKPPHLQVRYPHVGISPPITFPTWKRYMILHYLFSTFTINTRREFFAMLRKAHEVTPHHFSPKYGVTMGDFCTWYHMNTGRS